MSEAETSPSTEQQAPPRRHHYVPAFMLQGFTPSGRRDDLLWVHDGEQQKAWQTKPDRTAHERDYYRVDLVDTDPYIVEKTFAIIEGEAAALINGMQQSGKLPEGEGFEQLIQFVTLLAFRTPSLRDLYERNMSYVGRERLKFAISHRAFFERFLEDQRQAGNELLPPGTTYEELRDFALDDEAYDLVIPRTESVQMILKLLPDLVPVFLARRWSLLLAAQGEGSFICSDMPVSITPTRPDFEQRFLGFGLPETELTVPLSRSMVLVGSYEAPSITAEVDANYISVVNRRTMNFAKRFLYSPEKTILA